MPRATTSVLGRVRSYFSGGTSDVGYPQSIFGDLSPPTLAVREFVAMLEGMPTPDAEVPSAIRVSAYEAFRQLRQIHKPDTLPWLPYGTTRPSDRVCGFCFEEFDTKRAMFDHLVHYGHLEKKPRNRGHRAERTHMVSELCNMCVRCRHKFGGLEELRAHYMERGTECYRGAGAVPLPAEQDVVPEDPLSGGAEAHAGGADSSDSSSARAGAGGGAGADSTDSTPQPFAGAPEDATKCVGCGRCCLDRSAVFSCGHWLCGQACKAASALGDKCIACGNTQRFTVPIVKLG